MAEYSRNERRVANVSTWYEMPDNYIYISHLFDEKTGNKGIYLKLPTYPDSVQDGQSSNYGQQNSLARTAPVYTYQNSSGREMQFSIQLNRDMMDSVNVGGQSNVSLEDGQDYVDKLINILQTLSLPRYNLKNKFVEPPTVAVRITNQIFIKGVVTGKVGVVYEKPILQDGKYANVTISFNIAETDPYDATTVEKNGGFRGLTRGMRKGFHLEGE